MTGRIVLTASILALIAPCALQAQTDGDREGVRSAAMDYIEGFYEGDVARIRRSIRPEVVKFGFFAQDGRYASEPMPFDEMIAYAERVRQSGRGAPPGAPKGVQILDIRDQTAAVKVTAWWGTDYMHLAKYDGKWMILHVLWQSEPPAA